MKRTRLKPRSAKAAKVDAARRVLRKRLVDEDPLCRRCQTAFGTDLHEKLRRSQGGDPTSELEVTLICRDCHQDIHANPQRAREEGWLTFRKDLLSKEAS